MVEYIQVQAINYMMKNITKQIKKAISIDTVWSISDFYSFIEELNSRGLKTSYWEDEENWATLLYENIVIGYIWQKYPLVLIKENFRSALKMSIKEFNYIVFIESKDLMGQEFILNMDEDLAQRINFEIGTQKFSANDFWFHNI